MKWVHRRQLFIVNHKIFVTSSQREQCLGTQALEGARLLRGEARYFIKYMRIVIVDMTSQVSFGLEGIGLNAWNMLRKWEKEELTHLLLLLGRHKLILDHWIQMSHCLCIRTARSWRHHSGHHRTCLAHWRSSRYCHTRMYWLAHSHARLSATGYTLV